MLSGAEAEQDRSAGDSMTKQVNQVIANLPLL